MKKTIFSLLLITYNLAPWQSSHAEVELILGSDKVVVDGAVEQVVLEGNNPKVIMPPPNAVILAPENSSNIPVKKQSSGVIDLSNPKPVAANQSFPGNDVFLGISSSNSPELNSFIEALDQPSVILAMKRLQYQGNKRISLARKRLSPHQTTFAAIFKKQNVPPALMAIGFVESVYDKDAVSRAGARGIWQFIAPTGRYFGLNSPAEFSDPIKSTKAAAAYLAYLNERFDDWLLSIAAYNAGENRVRKAIKLAKGQKNYWKISPYLPRETRNYVPNVIAAAFSLGFI